MRDLVVSLRVNWSSETGGREVMSMGTEEGVRGTLLDAMEARTNSFIRSVGVPSMQECSPRNPERPFSYTITARDVHQEEEGEEKKGNLHWCLSYHLFLPLPTHVAQLISSRVTGFESSSATTIIALSIFWRSSAFFGDAAIRAERASVHRSLLSDVRAPIGKENGVGPATEMMWLNCLCKKKNERVSGESHVKIKGSVRFKLRIG